MRCFPVLLKDLQVCQATAMAHTLFHGSHHGHPSEVELLHQLILTGHGWDQSLTGQGLTR